MDMIAKWSDSIPLRKVKAEPAAGKRRAPLVILEPCRPVTKVDSARNASMSVNHRHRLVAVMTATAVVAAFANGLAQSPSAQLLPIDEAVRQPAFFSFRAQLLEAVARHDVNAVMAVVDPNIKASFGGDDGSDAFRRLWKPEDPASELWGTLGAVLALGGTFQGADTFVAPYTFSRWPPQFDSFEHVALVAADVRIREAPRPDAAVARTLSFAIMKVARTTGQADDEAWTAVHLDAKRVGYVSSRLVRSPIGHRAFFTRTNGRWMLSMFLAGD